jgi:hypothetical protein
MPIHIWADGVYFKPRMAEEKQCVLTWGHLSEIFSGVRAKKAIIVRKFLT